MSVDLYGPGTIVSPSSGNEALLAMIRNLGQLIDNLTAGQYAPAEGSVTDAKVAPAAAIAQSKIAGLVADLAARATDAELAALDVAVTAALALKAPSTGIAQAAITNLVADLAAKATPAQITAAIAALSGTYVQVFHAIGYHDGTPGASAEDDTAAIQAAWNAAVAAKGEVLISAPHTWLLQRPSGAGGGSCIQHNAPTDATIRIAKGATVKLADGQTTGAATCHMFKFGDGTGAFARSALIVEGTLDGNRANNPVDGGRDISSDCGVVVGGAFTDVTVECRDGGRIINTVGDAVVAVGPNPGADTRASGLRLNQIRLDNVGEGLLWIAVDNVICDTPYITNVVLQDSIEPVQSDHFSILSPQIEDGGQGIDVYSGCEDWEIIGGSVTGCYNGIGVGVGGPLPVSDGQIIGVTIRDSTDHGIIVASGVAPNGAAHRILVANNDVQGSAGPADILVFGTTGLPMSGIEVLDNRGRVRVNTAAEAATTVRELLKPWSPDDVAGLVASFDADNIVAQADGSPVTTWADRATVPHNLTVPATFTAPTLELGELNGHDVVRFDGLTTKLKSATFTLNQPMTRFVVGKNNNGALSQNTAMIDGFVTNSAFFGVGPSPTDWYSYANSGATIAGPEGTADTVPHIGVSVLSGAASNTRIDGGAGTTGDAGSDPAAGVTIGGAGNSSASPLSGDISRVLVYDRVLTLQEINRIGEYLADRYGLAWETAT